MIARTLEQWIRCFEFDYFTEEHFLKHLGQFGELTKEQQAMVDRAVATKPKSSMFSRDGDTVTMTTDHGVVYFNAWAVTNTGEMVLNRNNEWVGTMNRTTATQFLNWIGE